jgi:transcriptional adapter 2-alpha
MKMEILKAYEYRLQERIRRKEFAIERGLTDIKKVITNEKKLPREERELYFKYRPFARLVKQEDFDELVQGLIRERQIRARIEQLKHYRTMGITSMSEAERYEAERKRREQEMEARRRRAAVGAPGSERASSFRARKSAADDAALGLPPMGPIPPTQPTSAVAALSVFPGGDLLSAKEKELCASLRLLPKQYAVVKDSLIREGFRLGFITKSTALKLLSESGSGGLNQDAAGKLYDYFVLSGWIRSSPGQHTTA